MKMTVLAASILMALGLPATSQDLQKGYLAAVAGDYSTALQEWRPLADQGDADAQFNLGALYDKGNGVLQDYKEAAKYYRLAAEQGSANAQYNLATMYYYGHGVLQDYIQAHMWYNIASANGAANSRKWRDETATKMPQDDVSKAQDMARACMDSDYQDCG